MNSPKSCPLLSAASISLLCVASFAQAQVAFDDFDFRDGIESGDLLTGNSAQIGGTYSSPGSSFQFAEIDGEQVAVPVLGQSSVSSFLSLPALPSTGTIRLDVVMNLNENEIGGAASGFWAGFNAGADATFRAGAAGDYLAIRFIPTGAVAGRMQMRTDELGPIYSDTAEALTIVTGRDYLLSVEYNFESFVGTVTLADFEDPSASTSISRTFDGGLDLAGARAQFDFVGMEGTDLADLPYIKSVSVIPEPAYSVLIGGGFALALVLIRRRR